MRPVDRAEAIRIEQQLAIYEQEVGPLPGVTSAMFRATFVEQLIESSRRTRYVKVLLTRELGPLSADPQQVAFDPLKAAIAAARRGDEEEAFWLVFLFVQFGKHRRAGWRYARVVYGRLGQGGLWDWPTVRADVPGFRTWLDANTTGIMGADAHGFGNHRKYESLGGWSSNGTGASVGTYVEWVRRAGDHRALISSAVADASGDSAAAFDILYRSMATVVRFGRTARFDYLSMLCKLELAAIRPGKAYISGSTGPRAGAQLLFGSPGRIRVDEAEEGLRRLDEYLLLGFDTLEDALCNWQKSPGLFTPFRG